MNEMINKFLVAGDKFMPKMHFRQPGFTYSACGHLLKINKKKIITETRDSKCIYQNELDKPDFQHGMAYRDFKDLHRGTIEDKIL